MTTSTLLLTQVLLTCHPTGEPPYRFGFPLPAASLTRGLRVTGAEGARLQWRPIQARPDPVTGRLWVELCVAGVGERFQIAVGGMLPCAPEEGTVVKRSVEQQGVEGRIVETIRWSWRGGPTDTVTRVTFHERQEFDGEMYDSGETWTDGTRPERFTKVGIAAAAWRQAGVLPPGGKAGEEFRRRLREAAHELPELTSARDAGDYRRSREVMTNLEFDTALGFARLGLACADPVLLEKAWRSAVHLVDHDLDPRTGLAFRHDKDHRTGPPDAGHTWLTGVLLVGCLAADDRSLLAAECIARGLARRPQEGEGRSDRVRDAGWPIGEMEAWLRFADDPEVERGAYDAVRRVRHRFREGDGVFEFGEGKRRGTYEDPAWVTSGCLVPGLRAYVRRTGDAELGAALDRYADRLAGLLRAGKPGLPLRYRVNDGRVIGVVRVPGTPDGFMLLDGLEDKQLDRCLGRALVHSALVGVPASGDPDLPTSFSICARCRWVYR